MFTAHLFLRCSQSEMQPTEGKSPSATPAHRPPPPDAAPLQKSVLVCSAGKRVLWPPHPRHGLSQPVKTLLSWLKANLIRQTSAALGLFHNGQVCRGRLPGRGSGVCVCAGAGVCMRACACARLHGWCMCPCACLHRWRRRLCAHAPTCGLLGLGSGGPGQLHRSSAQTLRRGTGVFPGLLHLRPSPAPAEAKGPNPGAKPRSATAAPQTAMGTLNLQQSGAPTAGSWFSAWKNSRRIVKP